MELQLNRIASPLGEMRLVTDEQGTVWSLGFGTNPVHLAATLHEGSMAEAARKVVEKIEAYFKGDLDALDSIAVANDGSDFQRRVWAALRRIPAGATTTYGELARSLGFTDARMAREVGAAVGANPFAIIVPCHRVIGKDGSLKGYRWGVERKRELLERETRGRAFHLESPRAAARQ